MAKVVLYRDTGSVEPGSGPFFGSVSGSENHFLWFLVLYLYLQVCSYRTEPILVHGKQQGLAYIISSIFGLFWTRGGATFESDK